MKASHSLLLLALGAVLAGCTATAPRTSDTDGYPENLRDLSEIQNAVPKREPRSKYGNPARYTVLGKTYYTIDSSDGFVQRGVASFYGTKFHGRRTSSGEPYDMFKMTAAHKTLPLPTYVEVTNLDNGRSVVVKVNDRGPFHANRVIDLSYAAAAKLDIAERGTGRVEIRAIDAANQADDRQNGEGAAARHATSHTEETSLYVQAGAFSQRANAVTLGQRLSEEHGHEAVIRPRGDKALKLYRVYLGPLASADEAELLSQTLRRTGIEDAHLVVD